MWRCFSTAREQAGRVTSQHIMVQVSQLQASIEKEIQKRAPCRAQHGWLHWGSM